MLSAQSTIKMRAHSNSRYLWRFFCFILKIFRYLCSKFIVVGYKVTKNRVQNKRNLFLFYAEMKKFAN